MQSIFKPTFWKIALAFLLFVITSLLWRSYVTSTISDTFPWGFPLQFYLAWGPCRPGEVCSEFNGLSLILDIIIWYVVSAFIIRMFKIGAASVKTEAVK
jgi:hypothetical protein